MNRTAFTLIELLLVVVILGVLATIVVPRINGSAKEAKWAKCDTNSANLNKALELRAALNDGDYPTNQTEFENEIMNNTTYFPHGVATCPFSDAYEYNATDKSVTAHNHPGGGGK